jgi:hypothetical protein
MNRKAPFSQNFRHRTTSPYSSGRSEVTPHLQSRGPVQAWKEITAQKVVNVAKQGTGVH